MDDKNESETLNSRECETKENKLNSISTATLMQRQNSNTSIGSLTAPTSPNNSNSENLSLGENGAISDTMQEFHCTDKRNKAKPANSGSCSSLSNATKENGGLCEKTKSAVNNSKMGPIVIKEEDSNTMNVKKEGSLSPVSPLPYDSLNPLTNVELGTSRNVAVKIDEMSLASNKKNNNGEKVSSPNSSGVGGKEEYSDNNSTGDTAGNGSSTSVSASSAPHQALSNNCLEFMQQQNHVFVFSTQLANKAAESVLSGQYHSIIAYHCTQPQTKNFLDEFFMKNPTKMSKLPPRNLINMASQGSSAHWAGSSGVGNLLKGNSKGNNNSNKSIGGHTLLNSSADQKMAIGKIQSFSEGETDADLVQSWSNSRNALATVDVKATIDSVTNTDKTSGVLNDSIPYLQGRKVPDENLTPQQRQHREEQLAKLKKMNQFLFPENDVNQASKLTSTDNMPPSRGNLLINMASGPPTQTNINSQKTTCDADGALANVGLMGTQNDQVTAALQSKTSSAGLSCEGINTSLINATNSMGPCGPSGTRILMSSSASDSAAIPISSNNSYNQCNTGDDVISSIEWSKVQTQNMNRLNQISGAASNPRSNAMQSAVGNTQRSQPPPLYHSTQRSASVPIATQSPNPASPNNPTSNLSMPSPVSTIGATPGGRMANSPNMDIITASNPSISKSGSFSQDPNSSNNTIRTRQLNSNPGTPLSNMSPKDLENFNSNTAVGDSQQPGIDGRFASLSPGFNFPLHPQTSTGALSYKSHLERPACVSNVPFMGSNRRSDNMPLNPNSNRIPQNKLGPGVPFDPISSLAQMSQQLTSCVSSSPVGSAGTQSSNIIGGGELSMTTSNMGLNHHQSMDGILQQTMVDNGTMDGSGVSPGSGLSFGHNNMNSLMMVGPPMNPQHRLLNSKICGGFGNTAISGGGVGGFHGIHPHHNRIRMPGGMNFGNFNVTPNIQVKASTPNTIQYLPVRPQSNNNSMRAPPSLDFLPRYPLNPGQLPDNLSAHGGSHLGSSVQTDGGAKLGNNLTSGSNPSSGNLNVSPVMSFFQHCSQNIEQDEMNNVVGSGSMVPTSQDMGNLMRGIRPLRSGNGNPNPGLLYSSNQDSLDCGDMGNLFGTGNPNTNTNPMFHVNSCKPGSNKMGSGMVVTGANGSLCSNSANISGLEHGVIASTPMMGQGVVPISSNGNSSQLTGGPNSNMNYKSFVGPSSSDLKYAQQYHSFQQQLYATSTRGQQQSCNNLPSPATANVLNTSSPFYSK